ncbi:hypothetical protein [Pseudoroseomonas cervicalis]|uniref:hypothetical protein n=1 Tax=Teichococcus cervicalis TaxID=204525 RepID=UPI0027842EF0|nr:hypothetical protein [Pseudoroseomonas cervicalis]MDQ1077544.1 hypothetical protein [Pseudoroseomonas cervicalis]
MPLPVTPKGLDQAGNAARTEAIGRYRVDSQVAGALRSAAQATGMGFDVLAAKAAMESGFRSDAQAGTSSARGLFQFIDQTWLAVVQEHGAAHGLANEAAAITRQGGRLTVSDPALRSRILALRDDPEISARLGAEHLKDLADALRPVLGRAPDSTELYLGHFLGQRGATEFLRTLNQDPSRAASDVLPEAARANPAIFRAADGAPLSVQQVMDKLRGRIGQVYAQLGLQAPAGPVELRPQQQTPPKPGEAKPSEEPRWWGSGSPARVRHATEQSMVSTLVEVFSRMARSAPRGREEGEALPASVLGALREQPAAAARAYSLGEGGRAGTPAASPAATPSADAAPQAGVDAAPQAGPIPPAAQPAAGDAAAQRQA